MEKFKLSHVAMYAKGWYKRRDNIWHDMRKCLTADGYSGEVFSKYDTLMIIMIKFEKIPRNANRSILSEFYNGIKPSQCWKHGYYTKDHTWAKDYQSLPEYNIDEAALRYCLSEIALLGREDFNIVKPDYKNCLPRPNDYKKETFEKFFAEM